MRTLELTTVQGLNTVAVTAAIGALLDARLGHDVAVRVVAGGDWTRLATRLTRGELDIGWICSATFAAAAAHGAPLELLAAPQWAAPRYGGAPRYFSDIVVHADHSAASFEQLAGARFAFNEPTSLSGYLAVLDELARRGARRGFFAAVVETGTHHASLDALQTGRADVAAIDSTVLDYLRAQRGGELARRLRAVATLGPFPSPPWTVAHRVPAALRARLRAELCALHEHEAGRAALQCGALARFVAARADDYAPIGELMRRAASVSPV